MLWKHFACFFVLQSYSITAIRKQQVTHTAILFSWMLFVPLGDFQLQMKFQSQNQRSFLKFCREETWITNKKGKLTLSNINTRWCCSHRYLTQQLCCTLLELSVLFHLELQLTEMKKVTGKWIMKEDRVISSQICLILGCIWIKTLNTWKVLIYFINQEQPRAFQHLKFSCIAMKIDFTDQNIFTCTKTQQSIPQKLLQKMDAKWKGKSRESQGKVKGQSLLQ